MRLRVQYTVSKEEIDWVRPFLLSSIDPVEMEVLTKKNEEN
jgi:hypothetical protein